MARMLSSRSLLLTTLCGCVALCGLALASSQARAGDDEDFDFLQDSDDDSTKTDDSTESDDASQSGDDSTPSDDGDKSGDDLGFDGTPTTQPDDFDFTEPDDDAPLDEVKLDKAGMDDAGAYRAQQKAVEGLDAEEESLEWQRYLRKYPNSQFRSRIESRMGKLKDAMYSSSIETHQEVEEKGKAELHFAQPFTLENIDPRKKLLVGIEFGLPGYLAPKLDFEWAVLRNLSFHAGVRGRYGGVSFEPGVHYALVKSARSHTLVTLIGDARVNLNPAYVGFRPQAAVGQRFKLGKTTNMDAQLQLGTELVSYGIFSPRFVGGANVSIAPSDTVHFFFETQSYMKDLTWQEGHSFRFNVVSFGVKFLERGKGENSRFEAGGGAIAPYTSNYWSFHSGAIGLDLNYFL